MPKLCSKLYKKDKKPEKTKKPKKTTKNQKNGGGKRIMRIIQKKVKKGVLVAEWVLRLYLPPSVATSTNEHQPCRTVFLLIKPNVTDCINWVLIVD